MHRLFIIESNRNQLYTISVRSGGVEGDNKEVEAEEVEVEEERTPLDTLNGRPKEKADELADDGWSRAVIADNHTLLSTL